MESEVGSKYSSLVAYTNSEDLSEDNKEELEVKSNKTEESDAEIIEKAKIKNKERIDENSGPKVEVPLTSRSFRQGCITDREFKITKENSMSVEPESKPEPINKSTHISKSLRVDRESEEIILDIKEEKCLNRSKKEYANFLDLLSLNRTSVRLSLCQRLNCFAKQERILVFKNFFIVSRKSVKETNSYSGLNLRRFNKLYEKIDEKGLIKGTEDFESKNYSLLTLYHLLFFIKNFRNTFLEFNKNSIVKNALASTEKSVNFIKLYKEVLKADNESILTMNFQVFSIFFSMSFIDKLNQNLMIDEVFEKYAEIVFNDNLA